MITEICFQMVFLHVCLWLSMERETENAKTKRGKMLAIGKLAQFV